MTRQEGSERRAPPPRRRATGWRSPALRARVWQVLAVALLLAVLAWLAHNTLLNMRARGIRSGWEFLAEPAGFDIGESPIAYDALQPYWRAFLVGTLNTLRVALLGIVLATVIGVAVGVGRGSPHPLLRVLCRGYVEALRNIPLLLQLLTWYLLLTEGLPALDSAWQLGDWALLSQHGLALAMPLWTPTLGCTLAGAAAGVLLAWGWRRHEQRRFDASGQPPRAPGLVALLAVPALALLVGVAGGASWQWSHPRVDGFAVKGGAAVSPEFLAVLLGLSLYTAAFIAELVRAGIASVSAGQVEAAASLGLDRALTLRRIVLPQALRVIVPPLTNQYLNLTKNSSLAVAIGYPDLVSIANTSLNQTGRAVECIALIMAVYLALSLLTAALMNLWNRRMAIRER